MLRKGSFTEVTSHHVNVHEDLTAKTFFWYGWGGLGGPTTGGETEEFMWRMQAHSEGWDAAHDPSAEWKYNVDKIRASGNEGIKAQLETVLETYYEKARNNPDRQKLNNRYRAMIGALRAALDTAAADNAKED